MADRKLLMLTYHFPPSAASGTFRMLGFARHLPKFGWKCVVIAPPTLPWEPVDHDLEIRVPNETIVDRVPYFSGRLSAPIRMSMPFASWQLRAWPSCVRQVRQQRPEAILTSGPPHQIHALGLLLKRKFGVPWVADFRDPWVASGMVPLARSLSARWAAKQELVIMRSADTIVVNAPNACSALQAAYPDVSAKMVAITNGYDPERFAGLSRTEAPSREGPLTILHPGQIYSGRDPRPFLHALQDLLSDRGTMARPIRVVFIGNLEGDRCATELAEAVRSRGMESIVSIGSQVPYVESLRAMTRSHLLLLLDTPGRKIGVPGKLYEFIGAGRPVLALGDPDGDMAWVLGESGIRNRIAAPGDPVAIKRALQELIHEIEAQGDERSASRDLSPFTRESIARQLAEILDHLLPSPHGVPGGETN